MMRLICVFLFLNAALQGCKGQAIQLLVFGGFKGSSLVHLYHDLSSQKGCELPTLPYSANKKPLVGMMEGKITICGSEERGCFSLVGDRWGKSTVLPTRGVYAALLKTFDNSIWTVIGGEFETEELQIWNTGDSEFELIDSPIAVGRGGCAVRRNQSHAIYSRVDYQVSLYHDDTQSLTNLHVGTEFKKNGGCGMIFHKEQGDLFVAAGGYGRNLEKYFSTHILNLEHGKWTEGQPLDGISCRMASIQYQNTVLLLGGNGGHLGISDKVFMYDLEEGWVELGMKLIQPNFFSGVMHLPPGTFQCPNQFMGNDTINLMAQDVNK